MSSLEFQDAVVVVVDASAGSGLSCSRLFRKRGAKFLLNYPPDRTNSRPEGNIQGAEKETIFATRYQLDQSDRIVEAAISNFGRVDVVFYNVPPGSGNGIGDVQHWSNLLHHIIKGAFKCVKAVWPNFRKQRHGRIVFSSSTVSSNLAFLGFVNTLAREGAKYNIMANLIAPEVSSHIAGTNDIALPQKMSERLSDMVAVLAHKSNTVHSGSLFYVNSIGIFKLRWERSGGIIFNPDSNFTSDALMQDWRKISDFSNRSFPTGPMDFAKVLSRNKALPGNEQQNSTRFDGQVAIVTGGASGLGRCYCLAFARLGTSVVVNDRSDPSSVVQEISSFGGKAVSCIAGCEEGEKIVNTALQSFGRVDILVNNAGILRDKAFVNMNEATWDSVLDVHFHGTYQMTKAVWPHFIKQGEGSIVNTSSTSGIYGSFGQANYSTAKLGILGISEAAAREGAKYGIRVNTIAPVASTALLAAAWANTDERDKDTDMKPEYNVPMVLMLSSSTMHGLPNPITGGLFEIGCGWHAATRLRPCAGYYFASDAQTTPESIRRDWVDLPPYGIANGTPLKTNTVQKVIDQRKAVDVVRTEYEYNDRDVILYNLSVGAKRSELPFVFEKSKGFQAVPTFGIVPFFTTEVIDHHARLLPNFRKDRSLLGEHYLEIYRYPIPTSGRLVSTGRVVEVIDKGSAAIAITGYTTSDANTGEPLFYNEVSFFMGGAGGFGGSRQRTDRGPASRSYQMPSRKCDEMAEYKTSEEQAALYRLNADREDVHIDPAASQLGGFNDPILHGHCFMGIAGKQIYLKFGAYKNIEARFVGTVVPGDTLRTEFWKKKDGVLFQMRVVGTGKLCIAGGYAQLFQGSKAMARI